jgi:hypothetical protein
MARGAGGRGLSAHPNSGSRESAAREPRLARARPLRSTALCAHDPIGATPTKRFYQLPRHPPALRGYERAGTLPHEHLVSRGEADAAKATPVRVPVQTPSRAGSQQADHPQ